MSNRIKKRESTQGNFSDNAALLMGIFTLVVLCLFPLVVRNKYFDIIETKYQFYSGCVIVAAVVMAGYGIVSGQIAAWVKGFQARSFVRGLSVTDWGMIAFWLSNVISWLLCTDWRWDGFWGPMGRYNGVFLMTLYLIAYFLVTRFFRFRQWYLDAFLAAGIFVCLFGITDYFQMDILGFKVNMLDEQKGIYVSSLGNINTYTVYVGAVLVVSMILFCLEKNRKKMFWYLANFALSSFALVMGTSDNAYLTLAALFGFSPLLLFRTKTGIRRYMISVSVFFTVIQCIDWINGAYADTVLGIEGVFSLIAGLSVLPVLVIGVWAVTGLIAFLLIKKGGDSETMGKWLIYVWIGVIAVVVAAAVFVFFDANVAGNADKYDAIRSYVVFDDKWGTERGYVWRRSFEIYNERYSLLQKMFGFGPDLFIIPMRYYYDGQTMGNMAVLYDSAHNEYIHYLLTLGIAGLASYLTFFISAIVGLCRRMKDRPEVAAVMFVAAAYAVQAVVNINLPITMPIILNFIAMGLCREKSGQ